MSSDQNNPTNQNVFDAKADREQYDAEIEYMAEAIQQRKCILFLGSAIHAPAPADSKYSYPPDQCPPIGGQLSERLAVECNYPEQDRWNLQRVAWYYEHIRKFRKLLVDEVKSAVHTNRQPSPVLRGLARLGFPLVITTNYDQLYERSLDLLAQEKARAQGIAGDRAAEITAEYEKCIYSSSGTVRTRDCAAEPTSANPYLLKIHGDVDNPESIVITDEDYIQFVLRMGDKHPYHPVGKNVKTHLVKWPTLFIGYRLSDYNLRLLFKTLRWKMDAAQIPPTYAVDLEPDVLIRDVWENQRRYIRFIKRNLWTFVPDLYRKVTGEEMPQ